MGDDGAGFSQAPSECARQVLHERMNNGVNAPSGLMNPGWAAANAKKANNLRFTRSTVNHDRQSLNSLYSEVSENDGPINSNLQHGDGGGHKSNKVNEHSSLGDPAKPSVNNVELVLELPAVRSMESLILEAFGSLSERDESQAALLKRRLPEQKLFGYPKRFLDDETKRLASGIRTHIKSTDQYIELCKDFERDSERRLNAVMSHAAALQGGAAESRASLRKQTKELKELRTKDIGFKDMLAALRTDAQLLKERNRGLESEKVGLEGEKTQLASANAELKKKLDEQAHKITGLEVQAVEAEKAREDLKNQMERANELRAEAVATVKEVAAADASKGAEVRLRLEGELSAAKAESVALKVKLEELSAETKNLAEKSSAEVKATMEKAAAEARATAEKAADEIKALGEKVSSKEAAEALLQEELRNLRATSDALQRQLDLKETEKAAKDSHLTQAMATFQQGQQFLQEQTASLCAEKAKIEVRVESLAAQKSAQDLELVQAAATMKESQDSVILLTEELGQKTTLLVEAQARVAALEGSAAQATAKLEGQLEAVTRESATLSVKADKLLMELNNERKAHATEAKEQGEQLEKSEATIKELREKCEALESEITALQSSMELAAGSGSSGEQSVEQLARFTEVSKEAELLKRQVMDRDRLVTELAEARTALKETEEQLFAADKKKRELHNEVQSLRGKVRVVARIRPLVKVRANHDEDMEIGTDLPDFLSTSVDSTALALSTEQATSTNGSQVKKHSFSFDHVFKPAVLQEDVFQEVSCFVQSALDGYNVCLFSYGQTGSGKTWTMTGEHADPVKRGIIPRAIDQILSYQTELRAKGWEYTLEASYVEIYNETILDLLTAGGNGGTKGSSGSSAKASKLEIRDSKREIIVTNANKLPMASKNEINRVLDLAERNRSVASTDSNLHSSRSHSVFTLFIKGVNKEFGASVNGSLSMCDLAGSERIARSGAEGDRLKEALAINKSLSALANVFGALHTKSSHVPYRNSKLTHMLQPCFAGEGKAMMIVNLSPEEADKNESLCSLRFAGQVSATELGRAKKQITEAK